LETLKPVADSSDILNIQSEVKKVYVDRSINNYIVDYSKPDKIPFGNKSGFKSKRFSFSIQSLPGMGFIQ